MKLLVANACIQHAFYVTLNETLLWLLLNIFEVSVKIKNCEDKTEFKGSGLKSSTNKDDVQTMTEQKDDGDDQRVKERLYAASVVKNESY
jgi:hypothetical protein